MLLETLANILRRVILSSAPEDVDLILDCPYDSSWYLASRSQPLHPLKIIHAKEHMS